MIVDDIFLDRVAHDLRGELSTMLAGVQYLQRFGRDGKSPTSSHDMLERVSEAGERLTRLLEEFDDCVWLLDKPKPLVLEPVRLRALLDELLSRANKLQAVRGVRLHVDVEAGDDREFVGDSDMLVRALLYVADFAMLRAPAHQVNIHAGFIDEFPVIRIEDAGAHVPERLRDRLLDPFVENELASLLPQGRRRVRLGLGLAISRGILEAHGGSIAIESLAPTSSAGLVFRCILTR